MSETESSFTALSWKIPSSLQNFVPKYSRFFIYKKYGLFFAWRNDVSLILTFNHNTTSFSSLRPLRSQVILSKEHILDIVLIGNCLYFVSSRGLFQVLCSNERVDFGDVLNHLGDCKTFSLSDAFELSPLKNLFAVISVPDDGSTFHNSFAVVTCSRDGNKVNAELYSVSQKEKCRPECHLQFTSSICSNSLQNADTCVCSFLNCYQAKTLFSDFKDAAVLLIGLDSGQLFCVPYFKSARKFGIKPSARLIYQSQWPINGLTCSSDGSSVFIFLQGGTVVNISPFSSQSSKSTCPSLSYKSFTLPYPMRCCSALKYDLLLISDNINTSLVHVISSDRVDVSTTAMKGVTAMSSVPEANLVIASTSHNVFYLFDPSQSIQSEDSSNVPWAGCNLDVSLQIVQDMRAQTTLLSKLRKELEEEDCLIKALSAVTRSALMSESFKIAAKVISGTQEEQALMYAEKKTDFHDLPEIVQDKHTISIEIRNSSHEEFSSSLWNMCLEMKSSDGLAITKNVPLARTFCHEFPFCTALNVSYLVKKCSLPIQVKADLVAEVKDEEGKSRWLKIHLGVVSLDISYFFTVSSQTPQSLTRELCDVSVFLNQMLSPNTEPDLQEKELKETAMMTSCIVPIPEKFRQPQIIIDKLLANHQQPNSSVMAKDFSNQSDKTVIWLQFLQKTVKLVFKKSCALITISSTDLDFLHSTKLFLVSTFGGNLESSLVHADHSASSDAAYSKAKNLSAVLETQSLNEVLDRKQLITIYQDLRNNVSSQIY